MTFQRKTEKYLIENKGYVALYGETELSIEEFYQMFEDVGNNYDRMRKTYDCEKAFPHVYNKISKLGRN
jgi:delta24-sterol reductase